MAGEFLLLPTLNPVVDGDFFNPAPLRPFSPMDSPPPAPLRRTLRTYARREDAEHAKRLLADHKIMAGVTEHFFKQTVSGKRVSGGCSLTVEGPDAAEATTARIVRHATLNDAPAQDSRAAR